MLGAYAQATIIDTIIRVMDNGPDDPSPRISYVLHEICSHRKETPPRFDLATYDIALEWFEGRDLHTYEDLHEWFKKIIY
jgi:hypothetical protein